MQEPTSHNLRFTESNFIFSAFSVNIGDNVVLYQVLKLKNSLLIFINENSNLEFVDLSLSMQSQYETYPISTRLFGDFISDVSKEMAARICKKLGKCAYVSCNLQFDKLTFPVIEKCLYDYINMHPDKF